MPGLKRTVTYESAPIAKRLRRVEAMARANRPEMRTKTFSVDGTIATATLVNAEITSISQGDAINERSGDRIKVWRVEVRGISSDELDQYLLQLRTTSLPTIASFGPSPGAYLLDSETNSRFTEWKHYRNVYAKGVTDPVKFQLKFKNGIVVRYNGSSTSPVDNGLVYTVLNRTTTSHTNKVSVRVWYTDA